MKDIYFTSKYCEVNELIENGKATKFKFENKNGLIIYNFIVREIKSVLNDNEYYDIVSPYGYGGPLIIRCSNYTELIKGYKRAFADYCDKNNIVSEFVRFHPLVKNYKDFKSIYSLQYSRNTLATDLENYNNPFQEEFSKSTRKQVRKSLKDGLTYNIKEQPNDLSDFIKIYHSTMKRNDSNDFYYFDEDYFKKLVEEFKNHILLVEVLKDGLIIGMGLYFKYESYLHAHLSGTLSQYLTFSPAYVVKYAITEWGKKNNYKLIHHGGGLTEDKNDTLFKFKKKFAQNTEYEFYVGKRVWNQSIYSELCKINGVKEDADFFPAYRDFKSSTVIR